ncbi:MAG: UDP-N-acetylmuramoyl-tripeptide--D-alanyl-D-alanine ligase [Patescibacteria group bacterium]
MRILLKFILRILAQRTLARYKPIVIGITGSVGKTTAKEAIYAVLNKKFFVWKNVENFNNEIGVPLAILGVVPMTRHHSKIRFIGQLLEAFWSAYATKRKWYPRYLVLELAADRPGDIEYLVRMVRPHIAVVTAIGDVPVHVEHYASPEEVAREKAHLPASATQLTVLNADDSIVIRMRDVTKAPVTTFGFSKEAMYRGSDISFFMEGEHVGGLSFRINKGENFMPIRLHRMIAVHQIYGILAATAVAQHLGMNLIDIADAIASVELPRGRMMLIRGKNNTTIIDDTYNASPLSMKAALDTLKQFPGIRKIALLGEMAELGHFTEQEHKKADAYSKERADVVLWCKTSDELLQKLQEIIKEGDVILVKGSRAAKMEKIVDLLKEKP